MVLSSGSGLELDLPLVLGLPLQLKLAVSRVVLTQGYKKEILALPALHFDFLLNLWAQPQGLLFLGALPGKMVLFMFLSTQLEVARGRGEDRQVCVFRGKETSGKEEERPQEERGYRGSGRKHFKKLKSESCENGGLFGGLSCALPLGEASSASFCLDGLWAQGQKLDMDRALRRSQDIWTHSCPQIPSNGTDTTH